MNLYIYILFLVNLYFTYRWLLLECKREFPFNDALRVLEVMWATLPIDNEPPQLSEVSLIASPSDTMISDILCSIPCRTPQRRALSCPQLSIIDESNSRKYKHRSSSLSYYNKEQILSVIQKQQQEQQQQPNCNTMLDNDEYQCSSFSNTNTNSTYTRSREKSLENSFSLSEISEFDSDNLSNCANNNSNGTACASQDLSTANWLQRLPAGDTTWLEEDNLFLHFVCISILMAHRNFLLKQTNIDEQEISIHFDRYRRRHNAERILLCARAIYAQYIQWTRKKRMLDDLNRFSAS